VRRFRPRPAPPRGGRIALGEALGVITIRAAGQADAGGAAAIYGPHVLSSHASFELEPPSADEMAARMESFGGLYPWLVASQGDDPTLLGFAYATQFRARPAYRWIVETGAYVAADLVGRGVGRLLYASLLATLEAQHFTQAVASITLPNQRSIDMHEAVGFRRAGVYRSAGFKAGQWRDVGIWQRGLAPAVTPPSEPKSFAEVGLVLHN